MFSILLMQKSKLSEAMIDKAVEKGWITAEEAKLLKAR